MQQLYVMIWMWISTQYFMASSIWIRDILSGAWTSEYYSGTLWPCYSYSILSGCGNFAQSWFVWTYSIFWHKAVNFKRVNEKDLKGIMKGHASFDKFKTVKKSTSCLELFRLSKMSIRTLNVQHWTWINMHNAKDFTKL